MQMMMLGCTVSKRDLVPDSNGFVQGLKMPLYCKTGLRHGNKRVLGLGAHSESSTTV
jgi:hypothetical protein